jgi:hypothetical protein
VLLLLLVPVPVLLVLPVLLLVPVPVPVLLVLPVLLLVPVPVPVPVLLLLVLLVLLLVPVLLLLPLSPATEMSHQSAPICNQRDHRAKPRALCLAESRKPQTK